MSIPGRIWCGRVNPERIGTRVVELVREAEGVRDCVLWRRTTVIRQNASKELLMPRRGVAAVASLLQGRSQ